MATDPLRRATYAPPLPLVEGPSGVYGNAPLATAEVGERIINTVAERLAAVIRELPR
jgi:creatinine amidohydrolase/Fe(II)-dependent formamide hydrolase-like protein